MLKAICTLSVSVLLLSCNHGYKFWDVSKFNIVDTALKDNEEIKLLYCSSGPDNNKDKAYYIQVVAVSQKSGDTVNILTTLNNGFTIEDKDKVFNYFDQNNPVSKSLQGDIREIRRVAIDTDFDHIAENKYPAVIGTIGVFSK